eukprot:903967_1
MGKKYEDTIKALFSFDALLSGVNGRYTYFSTDSITAAFNGEMDPYLQECFKSFATNKTQIVLNLDHLSRVPKAMAKMILFDVQQQDKASKNFCNVIRPEIVTLFPNLRKLIIYSSPFAFDLEHFLTAINDVLSCGHAYKGLAFAYLRELEKEYGMIVPSNIKEMIEKYHVSGRSLASIVIHDKASSLDRIIVEGSIGENYKAIHRKSIRY